LNGLVKTFQIQFIYVNGKIYQVVCVTVDIVRWMTGRQGHDQPIEGNRENYFISYQKDVWI